jgi:hypothetical protein
MARVRLRGSAKIRKDPDAESHANNARASHSILEKPHG